MHAVKRANLRVLPGKVTALVGESGSGKSVISQAVMGILPRTAQRHAAASCFPIPNEPGTTHDILQLPRDGPEIRALRGSRIGKIFQEPMTSLSPLHTIGNQIGEVLQIHTRMARGGARERTEEMLGLVGFPNPKRAYDMYPFELSGGLRQRAMIAMALICRPALLIADEPTTALDVTIQAQILQLLRDLQTKLEHGDAADHPRSRRRRQRRRRGGGHLSRRDHGSRTGRGDLPPARATLSQGPDGAVPHFDMKPGERLKALREVPVECRHLLGKQTAPASQAAGSPTSCCRCAT